MVEGGGGGGGGKREMFTNILDKSLSQSYKGDCGREKNDQS